MSTTEYSSVILEHYSKEAAEQGLRGTSTMRDQTVRSREVDAILASAAHHLRSLDPSRPPRLLELGCGNGMLLAELRRHFPAMELHGVDYSPEMVELAAGRSIAGCEVRRGDVRDLPLAGGTFDLVVTERCIINLLDEGDQDRALAEIHRVLAPGGLFVCLEAFTDGLAELNRAKEELGLEGQTPPHHNRWMEKEHFFAATAGLFEPVPEEERRAAGIPPENFLSSHYFVSRVLYPAVTRAEIRHNTAFVEFFGFLPPIGNFSPIQLLLLRKPS